MIEIRVNGHGEEDEKGSYLILAPDDFSPQFNGWFERVQQEHFKLHGVILPDDCKSDWLDYWEEGFSPSDALDDKGERIE